MKAFLIDVDGVMTDGKMLYSAEGKVMKVFCADDHDALTLLKPHLDIQFLSADHRGFDITRKRIVDDMGMPLHQVSSAGRLSWIKDRWNPADIIYMGDGIFDHYVFKHIGYAIAPADADAYTLGCAHYVTKRRGGDRAVAEAALHILGRFFEPYDPGLPPSSTAPPKSATTPSG